MAKEKKDEAVGERKHLFETLTQVTLMAAARLFLCPAVVLPPQVILVQVIHLILSDLLFKNIRAP